MRTKFFCTNFLNVRDIPAKILGHPWFLPSKPKEDKLSREGTKFAATTPSRGRPPPYRAGGLRTQKVNLCAPFSCLIQIGRRETTPTPKTRFSIWSLLRTPGRFTTIRSEPGKPNRRKWVSRTFGKGVRNWFRKPFLLTKCYLKKTLNKGVPDSFPESWRTSLSSVWFAGATPNTRPLPVCFTTIMSVVRPFSVLSKDEIGP